MIKNILCASVMLCSSALVHSAEQTFEWSYTGFHEHLTSSAGEDYSVFKPHHRLSGRFSVDDLNHDGTFSKNEVREFAVNGESWLHCSDNAFCSLSAFSYTPGGSLNVSSSRYENPSDDGGGAEFYRSDDTTLDLPRGYRKQTMVDLNWEGVREYTPTDRTVFAITAVPEPSAWMMLAAGLVLVCAAQQRRQRRAAPGL